MYKEIILNKVLEYVKKAKVPYRKSGKMVTLQCPYCKKEPISAMVIPNTSIINCVPCKKKFSLIDLVRLHETDKAEMNEEDVLNHLRDYLNVEVMTKKDEDEIETLLEFCESKGFDCVPLAKDWKNPIEADWTNKNHKDRAEWRQWHLNGLNLGAKTGKKSNITVLDIDSMPTDLKKKLYSGELSKQEMELAEKLKDENLEKVLDKLGRPEKNTLYQKTTGGIQLFYNYVKELPKTAITIEGVKIDLENDGGQVVIPPSVLKGRFKRSFVNKDIIDIPEDIKKTLQESVSTPKKSINDEIIQDIATGDFKLDTKDFKLINDGLDGVCNSSFIKLGGILRKELNSRQSSFVLKVFNRHLLEDPMKDRDIDSMLNQIDKYIQFDEQDLAHSIVEYLKITPESSASKAEMEIAVLGKRAQGEEKQRIDKTLVELIKEEKITKKGAREYKLLSKMDWNDSLISIGKPINFEVPYINDYAYFNWGDFIVLGSQNKYGKCHKKGTKILMEDGSVKNVEDIKEGDFVQGVNNSKRTVQDTCVGSGEMYEIIPTNNDSFTVNDEHILRLYDIVNKKYNTITVKDYISKSDYFKKTNLLTSEKVSWKNQEVDLNPYFLGIWLGDGHSAGNRITTKDEEVVNFIKEYANELNMQLSKYSPKDRCPMYAIVDRTKTWQNKYDTVQRLRKYDLINNKHIPKEYKINSRENRLQLLAGLIDSDGYLNHQNNFELSFVNKTLAKDVCFLARSLGFSANFTVNKSASGKDRNRIMISGKTAEIPTKIKRKQSTKSVTVKDPQHTGFKLKYLGKDNYYGFTLDGDKLYLLDNFIVNHNTTLAMNFLKKLVDQGIKPYYIFSESGGRFGKTALTLGMRDGDFWHIFCGKPDEIQIEKNSIVVYDWVRPTMGFNKTDELYEGMVQKLQKQNSFMICFVQLKTDNGWFAENMITQYPAMAMKYLYEDENDGSNTKIEITQTRDPKTRGKKFEVPCHYDFDSKIVNRVDSLPSGE